MSDASLAVFLSEIERSPDSIPAIPSVSLEDTEQMKDALETMYAIRAYHEVSLEEFISDVCESLREHKELPPSDEPRFRERLARSLSIEALAIAAKASSLQNDHERDFCDVRILTDARPIYGADVSSPPKAVVISHILKLSYHVIGGHLNEIYISIDSDDIATLRDSLIRAEKKAKSLQEMLEAAKVRIIEPHR
jgi:hypothetical protein